MRKKLVRSKRDRIFLGVLGGLAEYLNVDPTLIRLLFIVLLVLRPVTMTILYLLAAIIIPEEGEEDRSPEDRLNEIVRETERAISGEGNSELIKILAVVLILVGVLYLAFFTLPVLFIVKTPTGTELLAILLILVGVVLLFRRE